MVQVALITPKAPNGNYANMAKKLGYNNFNADNWRKGITKWIIIMK